MQSIITKYHGPGNARAAYMIAKSTSGVRRTYSYDHALSPSVNHRTAAIRFAENMNWSGEWHGGAYDDKGAEIWVRAWPDKRDSFTISEVQL